MDVKPKQKRKPEHILIAAALLIVSFGILYGVFKTPKIETLNPTEITVAADQTTSAITTTTTFAQPDKTGNISSQNGTPTISKKEQNDTPAKPAIYPININTASKAQLMEITGVGEVKAQAIIDYRKQNGRFNSIEEIMNVKGFGQKSFEKFWYQITV